MTDNDGKSEQPRGDQAFRDNEGRGSWAEMTYGGALSFAAAATAATLPGWIW